MTFYSSKTLTASQPADESELSKHTRPVRTTVPSNASEHADRKESALATGVTSVGDGFIAANKAVTKGVREFTSAISDAAGKVQSGIAQAQSAAQDPVGFAIGLAEQAGGFSVPSSPEGIVALLKKFNKPKAQSDGTVDITDTKDESDSLVEELGDTAGLTAEQISSKVSGISSAISQVGSTISETAGAITELASLGGVPVDNVVSQSIQQVSQPVQSTLSKVQNVSDGTQGIIT